jgi:hypothetical protein
MKIDRIRGWFGYPVESQELLVDGVTAVDSGGAPRDGWPDATVARVFIHEAVKVDLA